MDVAVKNGALEEVSSKNTAKKRGLSGSTLKIIAMVTMLIDHVGAAVLARMIMQFWQLPEIVRFPGLWEMFPWLADPDMLIIVYTISRWIGRIAFPIYCFLLVEGFMHTKSRWKYALRLGIFALLSEIPFDLAFQSRIFGFEFQNVFFTLLIGLLTMVCCEWLQQRKWTGNEVFNKVIGIICFLAVCSAGAVLAEFLRTDYGARGVFAIMVLYLFRRTRPAQLVAGAVSFYWELPALLAFVPLAFYNNQKGLNLKYVFYVFYPLHLLMLYFLCNLLGIGAISAI